MIIEQLESLSQEKIYEKNFVQLSKIGEGGFAVVFKALHKIDDTEYAVKQIHLKIKDVKDDLQKHYEKLIREAKYLAQVNHPNVIRYYQSWIEVTEKKKQQKKEEQKRQTQELSAFLASQLSKNTKEQKEHRNNYQISINGNQHISADIKQQVEDLKILINNNKDSRSIHNKESSHQEYLKSKHEEKKESELPNSNNHQKSHFNNHSQQKEEEENNDDSQTFYFECDGDNEVVFIEENSKSIANDENSKSNKEEENSPSQEQIDQQHQQGDSGHSKQINDESENSQKKFMLNQVDDKVEKSEDKHSNKSDFQLVIESSDQLQSKFDIDNIEADQFNEQNHNAKADDDNLNQQKENQLFQKQNQFVQQQQIQQQQQVQQSIGAQLSNTRSFERRKIKSVDYMTVGQKKREVELDKFDEIIFFLQTELCKQTLADYLVNRNKKLFSNFSGYLTEDAKCQAIQILKQVIKGLYHIHHVCKMVHRDLKPHNIFLTEQLQPKIGDFGLVKKLSKLVNPNQNVQYNDNQLYKKYPQLFSNHTSLSAVSTSPSETNSGIHDKLPFYLPKEEITSTCGTATYASPEQLSQKAEFFDHRADIYSLGIIIIQLFHPMNTTMELVKTIKTCKQGELPKNFCVRFPRLSKIIKDSLSNDPQKRPLLSQIEQTLIEMELREIQQGSEALGKISLSFEDDLNASFKFLKIIRSTLYIFKAESSEKAEYAYLLSECDVKLISDESSDIKISHPIQSSLIIHSSSRERGDSLLQKLQKYQLF